MGLLDERCEFAGIIDSSLLLVVVAILVSGMMTTIWRCLVLTFMRKVLGGFPTPDVRYEPFLRPGCVGTGCDIIQTGESVCILNPYI